MFSFARLFNGYTLSVLVTTVIALCSVALPARASDYDTSTFLGSVDSGAGGPARDAYFDEPLGLDFTGSRFVFVADTANHVIEKINRKTGKLTTVAGNHSYGYVDGAADDAQFASPADVFAYGEKGKIVYVADTENHVVRKIQGGEVSTLVTGLKSPKGLWVFGDTLFIADTGNNRIVAVDRTTGGNMIELATGLSTPTKIEYWEDANLLFFVNTGEGTIRAVNINNGNITEPVISELEDIGGMHRAGRSLYVVSSRSIGVFNQIWKVRLYKPNKAQRVTTGVRGEADVAVGVEELSEQREVEPLNTASDVEQTEESVDWEEEYTWETSVLFAESGDVSETSASVLTIQRRLQAENRAKRAERLSRRGVQKSPLECFDIRTQGQETWSNAWSIPVSTTTDWQTAKFILKAEYQGDFPFFRVRLEYDPEDTEPTEERASPWEKGVVIQSVQTADEDDALTPPEELSVSAVGAQTATLNWSEVEGATYKLHFFHGSTDDASSRLLSKQSLSTPSYTVTKDYLNSNRDFSFRVASCADDTCGDWSELYTFRTEPNTILAIDEIRPFRGTNIEQIENGNFLVTLRYQLRDNQQKYSREDLSARVELCSREYNHPKNVTVKRLYVLYKGGSSVLAWNNEGKKPKHFAGKHRFGDDFGKKGRALVGRPKAIETSPGGDKMYISQNNKLSVYDVQKKKLSFLAGHVMDSYTEGVGASARFSDVVDMRISEDGKWLYIVDRNNHRIRKVNTKTGKTKYITGAGGTNFSFTGTESNGYQEGKACPGEFDAAVNGCAYFNRPTGIALSPDGKTLYVAEGSSNRIRAVNAKTGKTSLIAGSGTAGFVDGVGSAAQFNGPYTIDISGDGKTLYVADKYNHAVRAIDIATKNVTTLFGDGRIGLRDGSFDDAVLAIPEYIEEEDGVLYWTEAGSHTVRSAVLSSRVVDTIAGAGKGYADGIGAVAKFNTPKGMTKRGSKLFVADYANDLIRAIDL
jgi:DNA-binding beta-propeller fold protein YncE